jgi:hypothetical protein
VRVVQVPRPAAVKRIGSREERSGGSTRLGHMFLPVPEAESNSGSVMRGYARALPRFYSQNDWCASIRRFGVLPPCCNVPAGAVALLPFLRARTLQLAVVSSLLCVSVSVCVCVCLFVCVCEYVCMCVSEGARVRGCVWVHGGCSVLGCRRCMMLDAVHVFFWGHSWLH